MHEGIYLGLHTLKDAALNCPWSAKIASVPVDATDKNSHYFLKNEIYQIDERF